MQDFPSNLHEAHELHERVVSFVSAKMVCHSIGPHGIPLATMEVCMPRMVLAEFNTHRALDRNSASSRAIPVEKQLQMIIQRPYMPFFFGANESGMQAKAELEGDDLLAAIHNFLVGRDLALLQAVALMGGKNKLKDQSLVEYFDLLEEAYPFAKALFRKQSTGLHKQNANRVLEPYMWHTVVVSSTDWANFYALRCDQDAQPEIRAAALAMIRAHATSKPTQIGWNQWHLPYLDTEEKEQLQVADQKKVSSGRIARTSYLTHDGKRDFMEDFKLHNRILIGGHMSPFGHVATPDQKRSRSSNLRRWRQYRSELPHSTNFAKHKSQDRMLAGLNGDEGLLAFLNSLDA